MTKIILEKEKTIRVPAKVWLKIDEEYELQGELYRQEMEKLKTQCKHCGYRWLYKGKLKSCTCPNCKGTTQSRIITQEDEKAAWAAVNRALMEWRRQGKREKHGLKV